MRFQCVLCKSSYEAETLELGSSKICPNCSKKLVVPKKIYDPGRVIGSDFVIEKVVGTGGMGTVFLARQISLDRPIALKILLRRYSADEKFRKEFLREAQSVASMIHGNLVQVYAFGVDDSDLYLAMEYVEGITLGDRLEKESKLTVLDSLNIIQQVAEGLHYAWDKDRLIHRDIKPDNIMITSDGWVKLTDMGLARQQRDLQDVKEISGTPAYMNPEQFLKSPMDCRADIYSLGIVLYHCITGNLPFESENVSELARQHLQDPVEFNTKKVDIPSAVRKLIMRMTAKEADDRFEDHEDLLKEIIKIRKNLSTDPTSVPGIHTISFNRKDIADIRAMAKSKEKVESLDSLPRRSYNALAASDTEDVELSISSDISSTSNIFWTNLVAITAVVAALVVAIFSEPAKAVYEVEAENLLERLGRSELTGVRAREEVQKVIDSFPLRGNSRQMALRSDLLDLKTLYLNEERKAMLIRIEKLKEREARLLREKSELISEFKIKERSRGNFQSELLKALERKKEEPSMYLPELVETKEINLISNDATMLAKLWREVKSKIFMQVFRDVYYWKTATSQEFLSEKQNDFPGQYRGELNKIEMILDKAAEFQEKFLEGIESLVGERLELPISNITSRSLYVSSVNSKDMLIYDSFNNVYTIPQLNIDQLIYIWFKMYPDDLFGKELLGAQSLCGLQFETAKKLGVKQENIDLVFDAYYYTRTQTIKNYLKKELRSKALESALKVTKSSLALSEEKQKQILNELEDLLGEGWNEQQTPTDGLQ